MATAQLRMSSSLSAISISTVGSKPRQCVSSSCSAHPSSSSSQFMFWRVTFPNGLPDMPDDLKASLRGVRMRWCLCKRCIENAMEWSHYISHFQHTRCVEKCEVGIQDGTEWTNPVRQAGAGTSKECPSNKACAFCPWKLEHVVLQAEEDVKEATHS